MYEKILWEEFEPLYNNHLKWLRGEDEGKRLELHNRDFSYLNFSKLNLSFAILSYNSFRNTKFLNANLSGIDLSNCILYGADFKFANLYASKLNNNDFYFVDLRNANLSFSEINYSNFRDAKIKDSITENLKINIFSKGYPLACPEKGSFIGFKNAQGYIVELLILEESKRSSAFGRKCRCDKAKVLSITKKDGSIAEISSIESNYDKNFIYTIGEIVSVKNFDNNRWNECSEGIHFYITREEALYA